MDELKKNVLEVIDKINGDWVDALKSAEKEGTGIDLTDMMGKFSKNIKDLDQHFRDAIMRIFKKKKGGWF